MGTQAQGTVLDAVLATDVQPTGGSVHPDPPWWLDPARYAEFTRAVAEQLARRDRRGPGLRPGAWAFTEVLAASDAQLDDGPASCRQPVVVTSHEAFGHLTDRYGLEQVGMAGLGLSATMCEVGRRDARGAGPGAGLRAARSCGRPVP